jgi:ZIP family zinc transporter
VRGGDQVGRDVLGKWLWTLGGTSFIFLMTILGASAALFIRKGSRENVGGVFLGFAAGVMMAASVFSLIIPAIEEAEKHGTAGVIPAAGGFAAGVLFLLALDTLASRFRSRKKSETKRSTLLIYAMTLHNIPEGMAVGLAFALGAEHGGTYATACALALGIGIQNFPEGAAVSLPLRHEGYGRFKAFAIGCLSGSVELIFGLLAALCADFVAPVMPWFLCFAAGAMMYVVVEELIPDAMRDKRPKAGALSVMAGFIIMMALDVALG